MTRAPSSRSAAHPAVRGREPAVDGAGGVAMPAGSGRRSVALLRLGATVAVLATGQAILWRAGAALPSLPLDGERLATSVAEAEPLAVAVSLLRIVALGVGAALLGATAIGAVARGCGAARLVVRLDRWTPDGLCRLLDGALGAGLAASIGLGALATPAEAGDAPAPVATTVPHLPGGAPTTLRRLPDDPPPVTLRRLPDDQPAPPAAAPEARPVPAAPATTGTRREVVVRPGDSFWRLAERHETERLGRRPSEAEVGACWQEMVAANRHRLVVPGDPDLIFPGQVLIVPCP